MDPFVRDQVLARDKGCMAHRLGFALDVPCRGRLHVHHVILRSHTKADNPDDLLTLCLGHHDHAHNHDRAGAEAAGVIRRRTW